jgi:hypothetical protein
VMPPRASLIRSGSMLGRGVGCGEWIAFGPGEDEHTFAGADRKRLPGFQPANDEQVRVACRPFERNAQGGAVRDEVIESACRRKTRGSRGRYAARGRRRPASR